MSALEIRRADKSECRTVAELALIAGEGIPTHFWNKARKPGQDLLDVGAERAASETTNFSYRNTHFALIDDDIAGMLLAYRLPSGEDPADEVNFPDFLHPLIELEQSVPGSFYINMLATYPNYRRRGVGRALMGKVDALAREAGCTLASIQVFEQNRPAVDLYLGLGYEVSGQRDVVPHTSYPYTGKVLLLTREL